MSDRVDAVEIMNRFTEFNPWAGETPLPLPIPGFWFRKICALADRIAKAENQNDDLNAQVAALQTTLTDAINIDIEKTRELRETRAALREANEDAQACAAFLEIALKYTRDIGHPFNVAEINAALRAHVPAWEAWKNECK